jgi:hypothetical protein
MRRIFDAGGAQKVPPQKVPGDCREPSLRLFTIFSLTPTHASPTRLSLSGHEQNLRTVSRIPASGRKSKLDRGSGNTLREVCPGLLTRATPEPIRPGGANPLWF